MTATSALLRPALEAAVYVARAGEQADPSRPAPAPLRRYLNFARLPAPALDVARKVVDDDPEFRSLVAAAVTADDVGEAGWLWLTRPDGWESRLDALRSEAADRERTEKEERALKDVQRRLTGAEDRARRAEATLAARQRELDQERADLTRERAERRAVEAEVRSVTDELATAREQRSEAIRRLKEVEGLLAQRTAELRQARHEYRMLSAELEQAASAPPPPVPAPTAFVAPVAEAPAAAVERPPASSQALARFVAEAAEAAERLSVALAGAAEELGPESAKGVAGRAGGGRHRAASERPSRPTPRRRPMLLPAGLFDDSPEAAEHLLRAPRTLLLVDGYNVSQAAWHGMPIAEQRSRLIDALEELHARFRTSIEVVFDGAEPDGPAATAGRPGAVRVRFSAAGVEADDVVLDLAATAPADRPVVVASSDHRVRDGARSAGANVVGAGQLLAVLRR